MENALTLLLSASEAAALCGSSVRQWWRLQASGKVPAPVMMGSRKRWRRDDLRRWIDAGCPCRNEWESMRSFGLEQLKT